MESYSADIEPKGDPGPEDGRSAPIAADPPTYKEVRALSRGLALIEALNDGGWMKLGHLSDVTGIDRTTSYRLINTLENCGYVTRRDEDGAVGLSHKLLNLSRNLRNDDLAAQVVRRHLAPLTARIKWPSDFGVLSQGALRIAASTHTLSPMSIHRAMIGNTRPLFRSALGKAYLAALPDAELAEVLDLASRWDMPDAVDALARDGVMNDLDKVRADGFAAASGTTEAKFSAIALPIKQSGVVIGSVNIIFFRRVMTIAEAVERYLGKLKTTVNDIEVDLLSAAADALQAE